MEISKPAARELRQQILELKNRQGALILAHYYEDGAVQDLADFVGDSLFLAQKGKDSPQKIVLLAGVVFMAESVKILSPEKTVLAPDLKASCSLVEHSPVALYKAWKDEHPNSVMMTYINSSAEVKSLSDVICTSSNAEKIINSIPKNKTILFGPDRHLGSYLAKRTGRHLKLWPAACEVHVLFSARKIFELKKEYPHAVVLAHPECVPEVLSEAHVIGSTSRLLLEVQESSAKQFIVATESGILHQMKKARPEAEFFSAPVEGSCACNQCPYMKLNTLEKIARSLMTLSPTIELPSATMDSARRPLERMLEITKTGLWTDASFV